MGKLQLHQNFARIIYPMVYLYIDVQTYKQFILHEILFLGFLIFVKWLCIVISAHLVNSQAQLLYISYLKLGVFPLATHCNRVFVSLAMYTYTLSPFSWFHCRRG